MNHEGLFLGFQKVIEIELWQLESPQTIGYKTKGTKCMNKF